MYSQNGIAHNRGQITRPLATTVDLLIATRVLSGWRLIRRFGDGSIHGEVLPPTQLSFPIKAHESRWRTQMTRSNTSPSKRSSLPQFCQHRRQCASNRRNTDLGEAAGIRHTGHQIPQVAVVLRNILSSLTLRLPRASTHDGVRRERQSVERYVRQEYDADECSPA